MKTLRYLDARKDKLLYRRRVPVHLRSLYGKDFYYRQLNCPVGASSEPRLMYLLIGISLG